MTMDKTYLSIKDLMQVLNVSKNTAYKIAEMPNFPASKLGGKCIRIEKEKFYEWMDDSIGRKMIL